MADKHKGVRPSGFDALVLISADRKVTQKKLRTGCSRGFVTGVPIISRDDFASALAKVQAAMFCRVVSQSPRSSFKNGRSQYSGLRVFGLSRRTRPTFAVFLGLTKLKLKTINRGEKARVINSTTFHKNEGCRGTDLSVKNAKSRSEWISPSHGGSRWFDPSIAHLFEREFCGSTLKYSSTFGVSAALPNLFRRAN
jgi:hypothetical protein